MSGRFLKQSTASQSRALGPFIDDTDFKTAETGLTIANTDIKLMANGAASADKNSGGGTHRVNGFYGVTFDATDTATVGELAVSVVVSGALPVFAVFTVLEEAVYDAMFAASAPGYVADQPVNVTKVNGTAQTAGDLYGRIGAPIGSPTQSITADLFDIKGDTDDIQTLATAANLATVATYLDTEIADIKAKTDNLPAAPAAVGDIPSAASIASAVWATAVEGTKTALQMMRGMSSVLLGKASGMATSTAVFRDTEDAKNRVTATVDANGNRSAVTLDLT